MHITLDLQIEVKRSTHKHDVNWLIAEQLADEDLLPDGGLQCYTSFIGIAWTISDQAKMKRRAQSSTAKGRA